MKIVVPSIPELSPREFAKGWVGHVNINRHQFRMRASYYPDYYSSMHVGWEGWKPSPDVSLWCKSPENASMSCWDQNFNAEHRWLSGGGSGNNWDETFERAATDFVKMLMPESVTRVEYSWDTIPEINPK